MAATRGSSTTSLIRDRDMTRWSWWVDGQWVCRECPKVRWQEAAKQPDGRVWLYASHMATTFNSASLLAYHYESWHPEHSQVPPYLRGLSK